jgi:23S rRNA (adenine2030-N6)-methyltransferase
VEVARIVGARGPAASRGERCLRVELSTGGAAEGGLQTAGLLIVNPPWTLGGELSAVLPVLDRALRRGPTARFSVDPL